MTLITDIPAFRESRLFEAFTQIPFGFIDVGSMGGAHPMALSAAPITHPLCFEPALEQYEALRAMYRHDNPFADISILPHALGGITTEDAQLHIAKVPTNTSLLAPNERFISRYDAVRFELDRVETIPTVTLDEAIGADKTLSNRPWDFLKIDTQGSEWEILNGATKTLQDTVAVWCEVEFFHVYTDQKLYADIDVFLREHGFCVYALYPHYRSTKAIDRKRGDSEERLMWADALFFKDPLDDRNDARVFSKRQIDAIILSALLSGQYDYAIELVRAFEPDSSERGRLESTAATLAQGRRELFMQAACSVLPEDMVERVGAIGLKKFLDDHKSNASAEWL